MEFDSFLDAPRWKILHVIANKPSSPLEISKETGTSVAYISQQLKLLDAAGLTEKEKTGNIEKGKPRTLFRISKEVAYISLLTRGFSEKRLLELTDHHKAILKIWLFVDSSLHLEMERFYYELERRLEAIKSIFLDTSKITPKIFIVSDSKKLKSEIDSFYKKTEGNIKYNFISEKEEGNKKTQEKDLINLYSKNKYNLKEDKK